MNLPATRTRGLIQRVGLQYRRCMEQPLLILGILAALCLAAAYEARNFRFDASADTLVAQGDPQLAYYSRVSDTFGQAPFLVLTYRPTAGSLFTETHVRQIEALSRELLAIDAVTGVTTLLDAPLLQSPPVSLRELAGGYRTLRSPDVDFTLAAQELTQSPVFRELLVSADGNSTAIRIDLATDTEVAGARRHRDELLAAAARGEVSDQAVSRARSEYRRLSDRAAAREAEAIAAVRALRDNYTGEAELFLGGVPMVRADMVEFVKADMAAFGIVIVLLLSLPLYLFFRRLRWVLIPLGTTAVTLLITVGMLSAIGQPATAVSSSFVALLAIITISFSVHLITRYRELYAQPAEIPQCDLAYATMRSKLAPCLYTALTTAVAFFSLTTSDIIPVIDFGWMMCLGIAVSLIVTYSFFASILVLLPKNESCASIARAPAITRWFARMATRRPNRVLGLSALAAVLAMAGMSQLALGNRVVEYFRGDTEIRQGLDFIDRELGGTVPLDVVLQFDAYTPPAVSDEFDDFATDTPDTFPERFWFTPEKLAVIDRLQTFMETEPALGKSVSLANLERVARGFVDDRPLSYLELTAILGLVPEAVRTSLIDPYASPATGEMRISSRVHETGPAYDLDAVIHAIEQYAYNELQLDPETVRVTGIAVLFNDMLEQLLRSQLSTLGFVLLATYIMFALLLRSWTLAAVGLLPNVVAALAILGFMGYAGIPLDLMTIAVAAVVIGIGVDDAIHYLHRFRGERELGMSTREAVVATHGSIGKALYFTSLIVITGFSVLLLSRFVPTIFFGWLTALAMLLALTANLTLLPALLVKIYSARDHGGG